MPLDEKSRQISYQVAYKAAIELIASGKAIVDPKKDIGEEVKELTDKLFVSLLAGLEPGRPLASVSTIGTASAGDKEAPLLTNTPCPECAQNGRNGVLLEQDAPKPQFKCSLQQTRKIGSKFQDVGECAYIDWGKNGKRF